MARKKDVSNSGSEHLEECSASAFLGRPLEAHAPGVKGAIVEKLAEIGITDAEQFLAVAAIEDVQSYLQDYLGVTKHELEGAVKEARASVPESLALELAIPDPYEYGLGVLEMRPDIEASGYPQAMELAPPNQALPPSVNLISKMPPVRNQGPRGTCVAFTVTAMHDYVTRLANNQPNNFSEQHAYYETKLIDQHTADCGTWQAYAAIALANRGQCLETIWPYNPNMPCNNHGPLPANARPNGLNYRFRLVGLTANNSRNVTWIKNNLAAKKPVGISIPVWNSWYSSSQVTKTGAITMRIGSEPRVGGHAVCLVGYQDSASAPGGGYFLVRNSWGLNWGYQCPYGAGYGIIPYQYITNDNTEAFTPESLTSGGEGDQDTGEDDSRRLVREGRTVTIRIKGNVNLIIE